MSTMNHDVVPADIVQAVKSGYDTFGAISAYLRDRAPYSFRQLDRQIQKARKAGLIRFRKGRWQLVSKRAG